MVSVLMRGGEESKTERGIEMKRARKRERDEDEESARKREG